MLQELAKRFAISEISFDRSGKAFKDELPIDASSKAIIRNPNKCIHCGDCVRMCSEVQNVGAIDLHSEEATFRLQLLTAILLQQQIA